MTAESGLTSPPLKLPKLSPVAAPPSKPSKRTSAPASLGKGSGFVVVDGTPDKASPVKLTRRSSVPLARTAGLPGAPRSLLRRRSGDFSLPVRYKVRRKNVNMHAEECPKRPYAYRWACRLCSLHQQSHKPYHEHLIAYPLEECCHPCSVAYLLSTLPRLGLESRLNGCSAQQTGVVGENDTHNIMQSTCQSTNSALLWEKVHERPCVLMSFLRSLRVASLHRPKYVVIPGNNSRAVLAAFRRRPWWGPARKEEDVSAVAVVRSSFVSRRKKDGKKNARDGTGNKVGYRCVYSKNKSLFLVWPDVVVGVHRLRHDPDIKCLKMLLVDEAKVSSARFKSAFLYPGNTKTVVLSSAAQACCPISRPKTSGSA